MPTLIIPRRHQYAGGRTVPPKLSNNEKAAARVEALISAGVVVKVESSRGYYTVGPYRQATGKSGYAAIKYGSGPGIDLEFYGTRAARDASWAIVEACGSTRTREAAVIAEKKIARALGT